MNRKEMLEFFNEYCEQKGKLQKELYDWEKKVYELKNELYDLETEKEIINTDIKDLLPDKDKSYAKEELMDLHYHKTLCIEEIKKVKGLRKNGLEIIKQLKKDLENF